MFVVFVHHGQVVEHVFLLDKHATHTVLDDDGQFIRIGWVVRDAVWNQVGLNLAVTVFVLQTFAVQSGATSSTTQ